MNKAVLPLAIAAIFVVILASGCITPEAEAANEVKKAPVAAGFLAEHPGAETSTAVWSAEDSQLRISELTQKCGPSMFPGDYYYVSFREGDALLESWVYQKTKVVSCVYRNDYECVSNADCATGNACMVGECGGMPRVCTSAKVTQCISGDGCCPKGCTYGVDSDCQQDECTVSADCGGGDVSIKGSCEGIPKKCVYTKITQCVSGDNYCPDGCTWRNDSDCEMTGCETNEDCKDNLDSTADRCDPVTKQCAHYNESKCVDVDFACPQGCTYKTDTDCDASAGDRQRLIVYCGDYSNNIDAYILQDTEKNLVASFDATVNNVTNKGLLYYYLKGYKYNGLESLSSGGNFGGIMLNSTMVERIRIQGRAIYDREQKKSFFYFNMNGLQYEVQLVDGIPATKTLIDTDKPFISGNNDKVVIPLFGKDALVTMVNQAEGSQEVNLLSNFTEYSFTNDASAQNLLGNDKQLYELRVSRCDQDSVVFSLYLKGALIASQNASTGDMLFPDKLAKVTRLNYLAKDSIRGTCNYKYATGNFFEKIVSGQNFPPIGGTAGPWVSTLSFENNRLKNILFKNEAVNGTPLATGDDAWIFQEGQTGGTGFCRVRFAGLVR